MSDWTDAIVGERMAVDREFNDRVQASEFSSQEWGLIMTATEFEIEHADDPDRARIVADTEKLPSIMPELDNIQDQMAAMGGGAGGGSGGSGSGGLLDGIKSALGLGGEDGVDAERLEAAEQLTQEYADELQAHLEANNRFEQVRIAYQE
ncbi:Uncharacterized protein AArcCO_1953 [Halalkaliarchaeum sp. AArc-CO]|uniref:DUF5799 family protein n=1 Tax=unclassified Halalkaliarchaeum TaxID=2678344 RepID=UPI00217D1F50|nr:MULTISPECIES: DUF5799 family protein [unclassified Halalkaliarchaeum]MDR5671753.1 DUF5799 family protein [Halalkaliarchaeum sp. AArc-GB]UWG51250.1 Uncharacterized protein AArcCO_1953 [Halalkaliarchaeum sp. AArc-CO]